MTEDERKLELTKDFNPIELWLILEWYKNGLLCDHNGQPYTREYILKIATRTFYGKGTHA